MAKPVEGTTVLDGQERRLRCQLGKNSRLWIDDQEYSIKQSALSFSGVDAGFVLDGREARVVGHQGALDLVVDGKYLKTGKAYRGTPWWAWVFAVVCFALVATGGAIGGGCGAVGAMGCVSFSRSSYVLPLRLLGCVGICILTWGAYLLIAGLITGLFF